MWILSCCTLNRTKSLTRTFLVHQGALVLSITNLNQDAQLTTGRSCHPKWFTYDWHILLMLFCGIRVSGVSVLYISVSMDQAGTAGTHSMFQKIRQLTYILRLLLFVKLTLAYLSPLPSLDLSTHLNNSQPPSQAATRMPSGFLPLLPTATRNSF